MAERAEIFDFKTNLCVCAGAGSGKTAALVDLYLRLLEGKTSVAEPVNVEEIVAITFTEKAATEMKERIRAEIERRIQAGSNTRFWREKRIGLDRAIISTIHSFCARILRENALEVGVDPDFTVLDESESRRLAVECIHRVVGEKVEQGEVSTLDLIYQYGLTGSLHTLGLKDHLLSLLEALSRSGLDLRDIEDRVGRFTMGMEKALSEQKRIVARCTGELRHLCESEAIRPSHECFSKVTSLLGAWEALKRDGGPGFSPEAASRWRALSDDLKGRWISPARHVREELKQALDIVKSIVYQIVSHEPSKAVLNLLRLVEEDYAHQKTNRSALDFDDLQIKARDLLRNRAAVRRTYQRRLKILMIDEFQDTNLLQVELFSHLASQEADGDSADPGTGILRLPVSPQKLFIVGDPKQSIYRFRGGDVSVFVKMQRAMNLELGGNLTVGRNLALPDNFRSTGKMVDFFNLLFSSVMNEGTEDFEIGYGEGDLQRASRPRREEKACGELLIFSCPGRAKERRKVEATVVAARIHQMVNSPDGICVYEKDGAKDMEKPPRPPRYGDIALLFRRLVHVKVYERELKKLGIPYYVVKGRGFFASQEVNDIVNVLRYIGNQSDEVALAGILRSPLFGLSDEALLWVSEHQRASDGSFGGWFLVEALPPPPECGEQQGARLTAARAVLLGLAKEKDRVSGAELIESILEATGYASILLTTFQGPQRLSNVKKFIEIARGFERRGTAGLRDLILHLNNLIEEEPREPEAQLSTEGTNVVRLMTIHQAKGLEFPIVFLPDAGTRRGPPSTRINFEPSLGLGLKVYDEENHHYEQSHLFRQIAQLEEKKEKAESKRLFYVAVTRARDYLVFLDDGAAKKNSPQGQWVTWIHSFANKHSGYIDKVEIDLSPKSPRAEEGRLYDTDEAFRRFEPARRRGTGREGEARQILEACCRFATPHARQIRIPTTGLSDYLFCPRKYHYSRRLRLEEIAPHGQIEGEAAPAGYDLGGEEEMGALAILSPAARGILVHRIMEEIDFALKGSAQARLVRNYMAHWSSFLAPREIATLERDIMRVLGGPLRARLSGLPEERIFRELPFLLHLQNIDGGFSLFLDGTIDLLFFEDGGSATILDYKYAELDEPQKLEYYNLQLFLYALAVARLESVKKLNLLLVFMRGDKPQYHEVALDEDQLAHWEKRALEGADEIAQKEGEESLEAWEKRGTPCTLGLCPHTTLCHRQ